MGQWAGGGPARLAARACTARRAALYLTPPLPRPQAARRRAITELLFFASVGDTRRCQRIVRLWNLDVRGRAGRTVGDAGAVLHHAAPRHVLCSPGGAAAASALCLGTPWLHAAAFGRRCSLAEAQLLRSRSTLAACAR